MCLLTVPLISQTSDAHSAGDYNRRRLKTTSGSITPSVQEACSSACGNEVSGVLENSKLESRINSIWLESRGYAPREHGRSVEVPNDAAIVYLNERVILCTYDLHLLRTRHTEKADEERSVRAVRIDSRAHIVMRVEDWKVRGHDEYFWKFGDGHILVHLPNELRLLDATLTNRGSLPIAEPLSHISVSSSGDYLTIGAARRSPSGITRVLEGANGRETADEVYDATLHLVRTTTDSVKATAKALVGDQELTIQNHGGDEWYLDSLDRNAVRQHVMTVISGCRPQVEDLVDYFIFVEGCSSTFAHWYRVLGADRHVVLKGTASANEIALTARASNTSFVALRRVRMSSEAVGQPFFRKDMEWEQIELFRRADGKRVGSFFTRDFHLSVQSYALSRDGSQLAVLGPHALLLVPTHVN